MSLWKKSQKFNYLGILIDEHFSWNFQIKMIGLQVSKAIGINNHLKSIYLQSALLPFTSL